MGVNQVILAIEFFILFAPVNFMEILSPGPKWSGQGKSFCNLPF